MTFSQTNTIQIPVLTEFLHKLFIAAGFDPEIALSVAKSLVLSEICGHSSHGLARVGQYIGLLQKGLLHNTADFEIITQSATHMVADAKGSVGQAIMPKLLEYAYAKLDNNASFTTAVRNCGHIGRLGEWTEAAAHKGFVAFLLCNDNGDVFFVAPPGAKKAVTSTNPMAYSIPLKNGHTFSADLSTSAIAFGKCRLAQLTNSQLPPDCIQDANGQPTTDPKVMFEDPMGSILPMGGAQGFKGFALSMFVDMFVAGLSGGLTPPAGDTTNYSKHMLNNFVLTLWNPKFFCGTDHIQTQAEKFIAFIRSAPPIDPAKPVRLPGDRSQTIRQKAEANGISVASQIVLSLNKNAAQLNVTSPFI